LFVSYRIFESSTFKRTFKKNFCIYILKNILKHHENVKKISEKNLLQINIFSAHVINCANVISVLRTALKNNPAHKQISVRKQSLIEYFLGSTPVCGSSFSVCTLWLSSCSPQSS